MDFTRMKIVQISERGMGKETVSKNCENNKYSTSNGGSGKFHVILNSSLNMQYFDVLHYQKTPSKNAPI